MATLAKMQAKLFLELFVLNSVFICHLFGGIKSCTLLQTPLQTFDGEMLDFSLVIDRKFKMETSDRGTCTTLREMKKLYAGHCMIVCLSTFK